MRGTPGSARAPVKNANFFSTEIDGSGWPVIFWIFDQNRASPASGFQVFSRSVKVFSKFFRVFLRFSNVVQGVSGFLALNSDDGPPL